MARYYLGLDVHKVRTQYCLVDEGSVASEDVATLVDRPRMAVVLEATGHWCAAYDALMAAGAEVKLAHPARVKAIASARIKTDKIDARILVFVADGFNWMTPSVKSADAEGGLAASQLAPDTLTEAETCLGNRDEKSERS